MTPGYKIMSTLENLKVAIESCSVIGQSRKHRPKGTTAIIDINANYIVEKIFAQITAFQCNQFQHEFDYENDFLFPAHVPFISNHFVWQIRSASD